MPRSDHEEARRKAIEYAEAQVRDALERHGSASPQYARAAFQLQQTLKDTRRR